MKVICINNKVISGYNLTNINIDKLKEGVVYTVKKFTMTPNGYGKYDLVEVFNDDGFSALRFIPTSTIDEMELLHQRQTELV